MARKFSSVLSDTVLGKEDRTRRFDIDCRGNKQENDSCHKAADEAAANIHDSFQHKLTGACHIDAGCDHGVIAHMLYGLVLALHLVHGCNFHMDGNSHFGKGIKDFLRNFSACR